jgi:hypothetical protein
MVLESYRKVDIEEDEDIKGKEVLHHEPQTYLRFRYYERGNQYKEEEYVSWVHVYSEESYG